jgi:hypothetical protein
LLRHKDAPELALWSLVAAVVTVGFIHLDLAWMLAHLVTTFFGLLIVTGTGVAGTIWALGACRWVCGRVRALVTRRRDGSLTVT